MVEDFLDIQYVAGNEDTKFLSSDPDPAQLEKIRSDFYIYPEFHIVSTFAKFFMKLIGNK